MSRRWQSDGVVFWRKALSSNWWWYGEVSPEPASLPPLDKRPKFWRKEGVYSTCVLLGVPSIFFVAEEINSRYWPFNQTKTYIGRVVATDYYHPQIKVELEDKTVVSMGFPKFDGFGYLGKSRPVDRWIPSVHRLMYRQSSCQGKLLAIDAERWKFTFKPVLNIWEMRCATGEQLVLISQRQIESVWSEHNAYARRGSYGVSIFFLIFMSVLVIHRERKLYVKS